MSGASATPWKAGKKKSRDRDWEELGRRVEYKVMKEVRSWANEEATQKEKDSGRDSESRTKSDEEWKEIGQLVEQKIKRKLRKWAEED